jgi:BarA-like signal transduction histidine kinase
MIAKSGEPNVGGVGEETGLKVARSASISMSKKHYLSIMIISICHHFAATLILQNTRGS